MFNRSLTRLSTFLGVANMCAWMQTDTKTFSLQDVWRAMSFPYPCVALPDHLHPVHLASFKTRTPRGNAFRSKNLLHSCSLIRISKLMQFSRKLCWLTHLTPSELSCLPIIEQKVQNYVNIWNLVTHYATLSTKSVDLCPLFLRGGQNDNSPPYLTIKIIQEQL